ncbi:MAG: hypothetical protein AAFN70_07030 [Planctomycetota bacterium]
MYRCLSIVGVVLVMLICPPAVSLAQQSATNQKTVGVDQSATTASSAATPKLGPHRGTLRTVNGFQTETVVSNGGLKIYLFDLAGKPISVKRGRGVATMSVAGNPKRYRYDLFPTEENLLKIDVDISKISGRQITVEYQLVGIAGQTISYRDVSVVPADQAQQDAIAIARQKICPVSGKPLGSMGTPIAVDADGQRVFVCCAGCVDAVKANPAKYATSRPNVEIVAMAKADGALVAKQAKCPVMDESLGSMGQPIKLLVGGKPLFLCCKACIKKVQAQPEKYLAMVYGKPTTVAKGTEAVREGVFKVSAADQPFIAAQKRCPVMDEPLDAMGGPYQVNANGRAIYICCPGCAKKIAADPEKWLAVLAAQGVIAPTLQ